jgi:AraC family transcriptional regulator
MKMQSAWIDRNQLLDAGPEFNQADLVSVLAASRTGSIALRAPLVCFWLVVRGTAEVEARDGSFPLHAGEWIVLEADWRPCVYAGRNSLVLGVALPQPMRLRMRQFTHLDLHAGRGRVSKRELHAALRLWRQAGVFTPGGRVEAGVDANALVPLLRHVCNLQHDFDRLVEHCPGRSQRRKRQVFDRMQRARLFLEGNVDRNVRLAELAQLSNVSTWYFTKIFHALYGEGPQAMAARLRLDRAAELLSRTSLSVGEIGEVCGFENNCSFSRAFRDRYGCPPSSYRLNARASETDRAHRNTSHGKAAMAFGT